MREKTDLKLNQVLFVYIVQQKQTKISRIFKTFKKNFGWRQIFENSIIHTPSLESREVSQKM